MDIFLFEMNTVIQIFLALVLGAAIGLEREIHGRPAGLRTHILVCLGATIIMLAARGLQTITPDEMTTARITFDPGRIAAGIITGMGFLGAGTIIKSPDYIRGITTAACLWFVAALGIVIGSGWYVLAVCATVIALIILTVLHKIEHIFHHSIYRSLRVLVPEEKLEEIDAHVRALLKENNIQMQKVRYRLKRSVQQAELMFNLRTTSSISAKKLLDEIDTFPGIEELEWY